MLLWRVEDSRYKKDELKQRRERIRSLDSLRHMSTTKQKQKWPTVTPTQTFVVEMIC